MRDELKGFSPQELEQAAKEAREARVRYWDERFADESDDLADLQPVNVKVTKKPSARATVGLRLSADELSLIERTARERGVTFSEFVREAALAAASEGMSLESQEAARRITEMRLSLHALEAALQRVDPNGGEDLVATNQRGRHVEARRAPAGARRVERGASGRGRAPAPPSVAGRVLAQRTQKAGKAAVASALTQRPKSAVGSKAKNQKPKGGIKSSR